MQKPFAAVALIATTLIIASGCGPSSTESEPGFQKAPSVCGDALDKADALIALAGDGFGYSGEAMQGAAEFDLDRMERASEQLDLLSPQISAGVDAYNAASRDCRDAL